VFSPRPSIIMSNVRIVFASHPEGLPKTTDFRVEEVPTPSVSADGQVLLKMRYISVDPYMRSRMRKDFKGYAENFQLNQPLMGGCVGEVVESKNDNFKVGDIVQGMLIWQKFVLIEADKTKGLNKVPNMGLPVSTAIGVLGMPGLTAYFGLLELGQPKEGETVLVSGAMGAVGSTVGQIAKIKGCRVVGIAGSDDKIALLKEKYGFDDVINYKTADTLEKMREAIKKACPKGVDVYFDNTGGYISDAACLEMNTFGRIPVCGSISAYNEQDVFAVQGPRLDTQLVVKQIRKEGFLVSRWYNRAPEGILQMGQWVKEGKIKFDETVVKGIENTGQAFIDMLVGKNVGKMVVEV